MIPHPSHRLVCHGPEDDQPSCRYCAADLDAPRVADPCPRPVRHTRNGAPDTEQV